MLKSRVTLVLPRHRVWRVVSLIAVLSLVLAACGGGETDEEPPAETPEAPEAAQEAPEPVGDDFDEDAVLRFGYFEPATSLDPHIGTSAQDMPWLLPVFDRLIHYEHDGTLVPGLATDWELTDEAMTLTIREGVEFHDGTPLDAEAVKVNLDRGLTIEDSSVVGMLVGVESVDVVDDMTVQINLSEPNATLPSLLADRPGMLISPTAIDAATDANLDPIGAGGFVVTNYTPGEELVTERFDDYWDPDSILLGGLHIILFGDDETRLNALRAGEVDIAQITAAQADTARSDSALTVRNDPSLSVTHIALNIALEPYDDELVRRAINHAIDREAIQDALFFGEGFLAWQPFPPGYYAHEPAVEELYPYDPERARELLAEAGHEDGLTVDFPSNTQTLRVQASEALQAMLAEVGIELEIDLIEGPELLDRFYYEDDVAGYYSPWGGRIDPAMSLENMFGPDGLNNPSGVTAPELEELLVEARSTYDFEARGELFQEFSRILMEEEARMIPILFPGTMVAYHEHVQGYQTGISGQADFRNVAIDR